MSIACPRCDAVNLLPCDRDGLEIDFCPKCDGVWFDRGELDKLIGRVVREGLRPDGQPVAALLDCLEVD